MYVCARARVNCFCYLLVKLQEALFIFNMDLTSCYQILLLSGELNARYAVRQERQRIRGNNAHGTHSKRVTTITNDN